MAKRKKSFPAEWGGFIGLFRKLLEWEYAEDDAVFSCFVKLLLAVNYKDKKWNGTVIRRGSIVGSIDKLCTKLRMKKAKLRRCLDVLSECGAITIVVYPNKYHLIIVNNYNMYQNAVVGISDNRTDNNSDNNADNRTDNCSDNSSDNNSDTTKKYIIKKGKKVSGCLSGTPDTVKKENPPTAVSPEGEPPSAFDYEKIDWSVVQTFKGSEGKDLVYGQMPWRSVCRFARAHRIDDYTASEFHTAFERSRTPFPRNWEIMLVKYNKLESKQQDEFRERVLNGEFIEKWTE